MAKVDLGVDGGRYGGGLVFSEGGEVAVVEIVGGMVEVRGVTGGK